MSTLSAFLVSRAFLRYDSDHTACGTLQTLAPARLHRHACHSASPLCLAKLSCSPRSRRFLSASPLLCLPRMSFFSVLHSLPPVSSKSLASDAPFAVLHFADPPSGSQHPPPSSQACVSLRTRHSVCCSACLRPACPAFPRRREHSA